MIVAMRTVAQAAKVAAATGGAHLPGKPDKNGTPRLSRRVDVGADFETHRAPVEAVSVLFKLFDDSGGELVEVPSGWMVTAAKFEVQWPAETDRAALVRSHFGARRFAFNWGLARVKADLDAKTVDPGHESVRWDLGSLRKVWNRAKDEVAPWWATNSKECYSAGLADLAQALNNWSPLLAYKTVRYGGVLTVADRWFASSQIHHGCTAPDGTPCRLTGRDRIDKQLVCPQTGETVDRDHNAARNLCDWPDHASCGPVRTTAPTVPGPTTTVGTGHGADAGSPGAGAASVRPRPREARSGEAKTHTPQGDAA
jgi:hypothetical protein